MTNEGIGWVLVGLGVAFVLWSAWIVRHEPRPFTLVAAPAAITFLVVAAIIALFLTPVRGDGYADEAQVDCNVGPSTNC